MSGSPGSGCFFFVFLVQRLWALGFHWFRAFWGQGFAGFAEGLCVLGGGGGGGGRGWAIEVGDFGDGGLRFFV